MNTKSIQKQIIKKDFNNAYNELCKNHYTFNFDDLKRDFPKINSQTMYIFLMYAISINEDVEKHLAICYYLYFIPPYILGADSLIRWHLMKALDISPYDERVLKHWIFGIYAGNPDVPFSEKELQDYSDRLSKIEQ